MGGPPRFLVVEFTGARGVGKTTFVALVRAALKRRDIEHDRLRPLSRAQNLADRAAGLPTNLKATRIWSRWRPVSVEKLRIYQKRLRIYLRRTRRFSRGSGIYTVDEGIVQLMMMLHAGTAQKDMRMIFETMRGLVPFPHVVVSVVAPIAAVETRRKLRGNDGDLRKPYVSPRGWAALQSVQDELRRVSEAGADLQLVVVENLSYEDLTRSAEAVADLLLAKFGQADETSPPLHAVDPSAGDPVYQQRGHH